MTNPKYLNLDDFATKDEVIVKLGGHEHKLKAATVQNFIDSTKYITEHMNKDNEDATGEVEVLMKLIMDYFPSIERPMLLGISMDQLSRLLEFANEHSGAKSVATKMIEEEADKSAEGNVAKPD